MGQYCFTFVKIIAVYTVASPAVAVIQLEIAKH